MLPLKYTTETPQKPVLLAQTVCFTDTLTYNIRYYMQTFLKATWEGRTVVVIDIQQTSNGDGWQALFLDEDSGLLKSAHVSKLTDVSMLMLGGQPLDSNNNEGGE